MKANIKRRLVIVITILILAVGYHLVSPLFTVKQMDEKLPSVNYVMSSPLGTSVKPIIEEKSGDLVSSEKPAYGRVAVYDNYGQKILRFEEFEIMNGPGLTIYIATDTTGDDSISLGDAKATKGNVNYELPSDLDLEKYDTVLVWCNTYNKLYSYAELK